MIKQIEKKEIQILKDKYSKTNLTFNNNTNIYFGFFKENQLIGFCGLMILKNKAILKNGFVIKSERNKGIYKELNKYRFDYLKSKNIKIVESNVTKNALQYHLKNGAKIIKEYKICTKVRYDL